MLEPNLSGLWRLLNIRIFNFFQIFLLITFFQKKIIVRELLVMVLKQLGMASVSIQAGVEGFLELEPNSNTRFLSGRTVRFYATFWKNFSWINCFISSRLPHHQEVCARWCVVSFHLFIRDGRNFFEFIAPMMCTVC